MKKYKAIQVTEYNKVESSCWQC